MMVSPWRHGSGLVDGVHRDRKEALHAGCAAALDPLQRPAGGVGAGASVRGAGFKMGVFVFAGAVFLFSFWCVCV